MRRTRGGHGVRAAICNAPNMVNLRGNIWFCRECKEYFVQLLAPRGEKRAWDLVQVAPRKHWPEYRERRA